MPSATRTQTRPVADPATCRHAAVTPKAGRMNCSSCGTDVTSDFSSFLRTHPRRKR